MQEINKFDVKLNVIPNGLGKCMAFTINNNVFIDSMQFISSNLNKLVKNLSNNDFKYLSQELSCDLLQLVKQRVVYPCEYMDSFKKFSEDKLSDRSKLFSSVKNNYISEKKNYMLLMLGIRLKGTQWVIIITFI